MSKRRIRLLFCLVDSYREQDSSRCCLMLVRSGRIFANNFVHKSIEKIRKSITTMDTNSHFGKGNMTMKIFIYSKVL